MARITHGDTSTDVLEGYRCSFRTVLPAHYEDYLGYAIWFHRIEGREIFPPLQCLWPDHEDRLPWEPECDDAIRALQPTLYEHAVP
ncbi:MAG TPA: DUF4262 domain-containing protein [Vicinamibacterales bacterium]|nr:DUF4262 domain-containing protein [Vicinamibacterales bacterium]